MVANPPPKAIDLISGDHPLKATEFTIVDENDLANRRAVKVPGARRMWEQTIHIAEPLEEFVQWLNGD